MSACDSVSLVEKSSKAFGTRKEWAALLWSKGVPHISNVELCGTILRETMNFTLDRSQRSKALNDTHWWFTKGHSPRSSRMKLLLLAIAYGV
jgi:hypothetical protein